MNFLTRYTATRLLRITLLFWFSLSLNIFAQSEEKKGSSNNAEDTTEVVEEEFTLDEMKEEEAPAPSVAAGKDGGGHHGQSFEAIVTVDGALQGFLGEEEEVSFASNHEYLILGFEPHPNVHFLIEVIEVVYWELQYSLSKDTRFKMGKIGIPFGPIFLHQVLAGMVEKPLAGGGARHFMVPYVWTEYGLALSHNFVDSYLYSLGTTFWLTNGLQGEVNVADQTVDFSGESKSWDTNLDKAVGFRMTNKFWGKYGLNFSFYTCKWAPDTRDENGRLTEKFYEGDRMYLGNVDLELAYNTIPLPFFRNLRFLMEYAHIRTRSTDMLDNNRDNRVPWHNKSADLLEVEYNGLHRWFDLRFRYGTYDDNWNVVNNRDLVNYNVALIFEIATGIRFIPMYMWNRERVNEVKDDYFFFKLFLEL